MLVLRHAGMTPWTLPLLLLLPLVVVLRGADDLERALCARDACYTLHMDNKVNFGKASANCVDRGGYLMTVTGRQEEQALALLLSLAGSSGSGSSGGSSSGRRRERYIPLWIGLRLRRGQCMLPEKTLKGFEWLPPSSTENVGGGNGVAGGRYSNWEAGHPLSTCTEERCAQIRYAASEPDRLKWVDAQCRKPAFYVCKFYFAGMCRPLALAGPGQVNYTAPFSSRPMPSDVTSLPKGTFAEVSCVDGGDDGFSVCKATAANSDDDDGTYDWTDPGPFCAPPSGKKSCAAHNGGCEHLCEEDDATGTDGGGGVRCTCKDGYELGRDGASCGAMDYCRLAACEYRCVSGDSGFTCACPEGFRLGADLRSCQDVDECGTPGVCGGGAAHACVNTEGGYVCECGEGYEATADGRCRDVDECAVPDGSAAPRCDQRCLNSLGSFSCHCDVGFAPADGDGRRCADVDECLASDSPPCEFRCANTVGSFACVCPEGSRLAGDGTSCVAADEPRETLAVAPSPTSDKDDLPEATPPPWRAVEPAWTVATTQSRQSHNQTLPTDAPPVLHSADSTSVADTPADAPNHNNASFGRNVRVSRPLDRRTLICVVGSVVPLLLALAVTVAIVALRCGRRPKREAARKAVTADGYCWVSSGFEPHLEKLYESVLTDDPPEDSALESEA